MPLFRNAPVNSFRIPKPIGQQGLDTSTAAPAAPLSCQTIEGATQRLLQRPVREVVYPVCKGKTQSELIEHRMQRRAGVEYHQPEPKTKKRVCEVDDGEGGLVRVAADDEADPKSCGNAFSTSAEVQATTSSAANPTASPAEQPEEATKDVVPIFPLSPLGKRYFEVEIDGAASKFDAAGIIIVSWEDQAAQLFDRAGRQYGNRPDPGYPVKVSDEETKAPGCKLRIGTKLVTLVTALLEDAFRSGEFFLHSEHESRRREERRKAAEQAVAAAQVLRPRMTFGSKLSGVNFAEMTFRKRPQEGQTGFIVPFHGAVASRKLGLGQELVALHDHDRENAVVLFRADYKRDMNGRPIVSVVVDPVIGDKLRPHQRIGVQFLFDCITGEKTPGYHGAILADEMGLGKTIQTVATVYTCLKQGKNGSPVTRKAIIVAPSSLVKNWSNEFDKWLGPGAVKCFSISESTPKGDRILSRFDGEGDVLIISYDQLRKYVGRISTMRGVDLVVCDEGHRLKNAEIKTTKAISALPTRRRIILSGTPIQNDLSEFHAMVDFVNPGILGNQELFSRVFEEPIMLGRDPSCPDELKSLGADRAHYLANMQQRFILRRTQTINEKYLPAKVDMTVFVRLGEEQMQCYKRVCELAATSVSTPLVIITALKKLCNHMDLFRDAIKDDAHGGSSIPRSVLPKGYAPGKLIASYGAKLEFVSLMLDQLVSNGDRDKLVIVSNYTQTLDVIAALCVKKRVAFFQLDGSTPIKRRQELVDQFNFPQAQEIVFLLSSKAGGVGLNLIGANRLILFDPDWNPANDAQAMGRVWRDGQKKRVFIYRLLSTGSIEEKIYQRQVSKQGLSANVVDMKDDSKQHFTLDELKALFTYRSDTLCDTHDLLGCTCIRPKVVATVDKPEKMSFRKVGQPPAPQHSGPRMDELKSWQHVEKIDSFALDKVLSAISRKDASLVSFLFANERDAKKIEAGEVVVAEERPFAADEGPVTCCSQADRGAEENGIEIELHSDDDDDDRD
jgi:superfamily II DNA or RNA helicase